MLENPVHLDILSLTCILILTKLSVSTQNENAYWIYGLLKVLYVLELFFIILSIWLTQARFEFVSLMIDDEICNTVKMINDVR